MADRTGTSTEVPRQGPRVPWRPLIGLAGVVSFVGGGMHPQAPDGLQFRDSLAAMMADGAWVPGHALLGIGSALALAGLLAVRRTGAWPAASTALPFAVVAAAINTLELVFHTAAVIDRDELAAGEWPPLALVHLGMAVAAYPLFGVAIAWLAWRLLASWSLPLRAVSVAGIVGGIANALAAPLTILLRDPDFAFLFPIGGIGISIWLAVMGLAGLRSTADRSTAAHSEPQAQNPLPTG